MRAYPDGCVVDTNVPMTANGANAAAGAQCQANCARALREIMVSGHVCVDTGGRIVTEYRRNLRAGGEPGPGDAFLRWLLTHEWDRARVSRVPISPTPEDAGDFDEMPVEPDGVRFDPSDRMFIAVAAARTPHPTIVQSFDSKWWGWRGALGRAGIPLHFLCKREIRKKHAQKAAGR